jgi:hypothetical protein
MEAPQEAIDAFKPAAERYCEFLNTMDAFKRDEGKVAMEFQQGKIFF